MNGIISKILDIFFPPLCIFCQRPLESRSDEEICLNCAGALPYAKGNTSKKTVAYLERCIAPFYYIENVKKSIYRFKFKNRPHSAEVFSKLMSACVSTYFQGVHFDVVTSVPSGKRRQKERGYNPAKLLGEKVAERLGLPYEELLFKLFETPHQSKISAKERRANVLGSFEVSDYKSVKGKTILLVDDVLTTGATISECAKMLLLAGAKNVYGVTLAKTKPYKKGVKAKKEQAVL